MASTLRYLEVSGWPAPYFMVHRTWNVLILASYWTLQFFDLDREGRKNHKDFPKLIDIFKEKHPKF